MEVKNRSVGSSIGLCLSGGGFRASLFHLGVLRYLAEAGQLANVSGVSTVSGGSIVGAFLATKWGELGGAGYSLEAFLERVYRPFQRVVTTRNLRNRWVLLLLPTLPLLLDPRFTWIKLLSWFFDRWFYSGKKLEMHELPEGLGLAINATDMASARVYRFARSFHGDDVDGYGGSYGDDPVRLADAVTASSAQLPMYIKVAGKGGRWFFDGGAYDNTGLDWFLDWEGKKRPEGVSKPPFLIACEASAELRPWNWGWQPYIPVYRMAPVLRRLQAIQFEQTRRTRKDWFIDRIRDCGLDTGMIISIDVVARHLREAHERLDYEELVAHSLPERLVKRVRAVRTDLDCFLPEEAELLAYHSYWLTHVYLTTFHEGAEVNGHQLVVPDPQWKLDLSDVAIEQYLEALDRCDKLIDLKRRLL